MLISKFSKTLSKRALLNTPCRSLATVIVEEMVQTRKGAREAEATLPNLAEACCNLQEAATSSSTCRPVSTKHAAVLVPLFESEGEIHVILTQRSSKMRKHAGEVCFPGGKREPLDQDDVSTALREAHEELGLDPGSVQVVTTMAPVLSKHLLSVTPVIGVVPPKLTFVPNPDEVEHVFTAPLRMFLRAGPCYSHKDLKWEGFPYRLHYFDYEYRGRQFLIWGLTAGLLIHIAEQALKVAPEFQVHPPGAVPYTALAFESGKLVFRGDGGKKAAAGGSAAMPGSIVTDEEAEAAVGEGSNGDSSSGGRDGNNLAAHG